MKILTRTKRWLITLVLILAAGSLTLGGLYARGFWDETKAVHIKADDIEASTLAIGTHLIHLSALTDSIYELASQSADESGQNVIYYKSELGGNAWFNITSATSLADITFEGTAVKDEEIEGLFFTHHTKSDKVTYDLRTGRAVNMFNIRDPYDLEKLDELSPLKMYYDQIIEMEGENDVTKRIDEIWKTPLTGEGIQEKEKAKAAAEALKKALENLINDLLGISAPEEPEEEKEPEATQVEQMDAQLAALQKYLDVLTKYDAETRQIDKVTGVMEAVDAGRRYQVFVFVEEALNEYMDELSGNTEGENPAELLSALAESIGNVQESLITYGGKMLDEGMTVISNAEYEFSNDLIGHARANDHAACDADVNNLLLLGNLQNNVIADRPAELAMLNNKLIPGAQRIYLMVLGSGESAEYRAAVQKKAAQALLNSLIEEYQSEVNTRRGELEFLLEAKCSRLDAQSAFDFIGQYMDTVTREYAPTVPKDAFLNAGLESVEDHIKFLSDLQRSLNLALGGNEMDQLAAEKEALQTQRLQALDKNDLATAKALEEQISAVEEQMRAIEAESAAQIAQLQNQINSLEPGSAQRAAAEAELANLQNSFSDGSMAARVNELKNEVLDSIPTGAFGGGASSGGADGTGEDAEQAKKNIEEGIRALSGLMDLLPELAMPALEEIRDALTAANEDQALIDAAGQVVEDRLSDVEAKVADRIAQLQKLEAGMDPNSPESTAVREELDHLNRARTDGSVVAGVDVLKGIVLDSIESGRNRDNATKALDTLIELLDLVPELALPALQEIYDVLLNDSSEKNMTNTVGEAIGAHIESIGDEITDRIEALESLIGTLPPGSAQLSAAQAELENLKNLLAAGGAQNAVADQKQEVLDSIAALADSNSGDGAGAETDPGTQTPGSTNPESDSTDALNTLSGLLGTAPELVLPALQEIYNKLLLNGGDPDMIDSIEQAIVDNPYVLKDGLGAEQVRAAAKAWMLNEIEGAAESAPLTGAGGLSRMDDNATLAAIVGMQMYHQQTGDKAVQQVMTALAQEMKNLGNPLIFEAMNDGSGEYLPLTAVQALTGRRYVWNKNASLGILARGNDYYGFTVYSDRVLRDRDGEKTEKMARSARYQNVIYIPVEYAWDTFGTSAVSLPGTSMGCICNEAIMEQAQEMFSWLMEA